MSGCDHPPPAARTPEQEETLRAFYSYLAHTEGLTVEFLGGAIQGFVLREHVDECHPDQVEEAITKQLEPMPEGDKRRGYEAGYRFNEGRKQGHMQAETKGAEP